MAQFILKLLTPSIRNNFEGFRYLETTISEFYNQIDEYQSNINNFSNRKHTFCYSFNEKLSVHKNAQKELSFSMTRYVWVDNVLEENPFASAIHAGSQLLLIDKFDNRHFFTVKDIKYKLSKDNIIYDVSCQDSFTYQLIRQQDGYTIDNSTDSDNFIGAKSLDWWVLKKIKPECHISYEYVPLFNGVYQNINGEIKTFSEKIKPSEVKKILKPLYLESEYAEYYEKIPFSGSGSASSVLISLGDTIGMQLNTAESISEKGDIIRFFWFEPQKKEEVSGLKYSPNTNIQSFDFSHSGDSLTTVLNVEAKQLNDNEYVSLIPDIPQFFKTLFKTSVWSQSKYSDGFFTSICQRKVLNLNSDFITGDISSSKDGYVDIKLFDVDGKKFTLPLFYNKISFIYDNQLSRITYDPDQKLTTPLINIFELVYKTKITKKTINGIEEIPVEYVFNNTYSPIQSELLGKSLDEVYLRIRGITNKDLTIDHLVLHFYRDCNEEELNFAEIADKIPWLENKLINLSYFLKQNIISNEEYNNIMGVLKNDLRIVNGKVILHSSAYETAVRNKIDNLNKLTNAVDTLGAVFQAEVLEPLNSNNSSFDLTKFTNTYSEFKKQYQETSNQVEILDYGKLLTENFNNYFNAQQRFLKNIYEFKKYFNEPVCLSGDLELCDIKLEVESPATVGFSNIHFSQITEDSFKDKYNTETLEPNATIYENDLKTTATVIHAGNYKNFYFPAVSENDLVFCGREDGYNSQQTYYRTVYVAQSKLENTVFNINSGRYELEEWKTDKDNKVYYIIKSKDGVLQSLADEDAYSSMPEFTGVTKELYDVTLHEIIGEYLYSEQLKPEAERVKWKQRDTNTYESPSKWLNRTSIINFMDNLTPSSLLFIGVSGDSKYEGLLKKEDDQYSEDERNKLLSLYIENFPISSLRYRGPKHITKLYEYSDDTAKTPKICSVQQVNAKGQTWFDYIKDPTIQKPSDYIWETTVDLVTPYNVASYYRQTVTDSAAGWGIFWGILGTVATSALCGGVFAGIGGIAGTIGVSIGATFGAAAGLNFGSAIAKAHWQQHMEWRSTGWNIADAFGNLVQAPYYEGYFFEEKVGNQNQYYWNFVTSPTAKQEFDEVVAASQEEVCGIDENNNLQFRTKSDIPTDYKHCFEYFGLTYPQVWNLYNQDEINGWVKPPKKANWISQNNNNQKPMLEYKDGYLRFLKDDSRVNKNDKYYILIDECKHNRNGGTTTVFKNKLDLSENSDRLSVVLYYPLTFFLKPLYVNNVDFGNSTTLSVEEVLENSGVSNIECENYYFTGSVDGKRKKFYIIKEEAYNVNEIFSKEQSDYTRKYSGNPIYNIETDEKINFLQTKGIVAGLNYYVSKEGEVAASNMISMALDVGEFEIKDGNCRWIRKDNSGNIISTHTRFYRKDANEKFVRVYSILQVLNFDSSDRYYYSKTSSYSTQLLKSSNELGFDLNFQMYLYEKTTNKDGSETVKTKLLDDPVDLHIDQTDKFKTFSISLPNTGETVDVSVNVTIKIQNIANTNNGLFAIMYRNLSDFPSIQQRAALIEKELSLYWNQAYIASKSCEYFLPEFWTPKVNGNSNPFFGEVVLLTYDKEDKEDKNNKKLIVKSATLLDTFIPAVEMYFSSGTVKAPTYSIRHVYDVDEEQPVEDDMLKNIEDSNLISATSLSDFTPLINAFKNISAEPSDFFVDVNKYVTKVYYYVSEESSGGVLWKDVLEKITNKKYEVGKFNGNYIMIYNALKQSFKKDTSYEDFFKYKQQQSHIWDRIYKNYGSIILEKNYKNEDATTNKDLYNMSTLAFKDLSEPQKNYNITTINSNTLNGYLGQELKIGDGILIDAEEYYQEYDDIKETLSRYLFITDMSYNLRKDSDISLTVNSIKYEDKLIQRLANLIK